MQPEAEEGLHGMFQAPVMTQDPVALEAAVLEEATEMTELVDLGL